MPKRKCVKRWCFCAHPETAGDDLRPQTSNVKSATLSFGRRYFVATTTVSGMGSACPVTFENPAAIDICRSSASVYALPAGVPASIVRLKAAAIGGVTQSSFGTNSSMTAFPPGFSAAATFRNSVVFVGTS